MPLIARSFRRKIVATLVAVASFVLLYQATIRDSRTARETSMHDPTVIPMAGSKLQFAATAYCKGTTTASGVNVTTGIAAADPALLPVGSVISVSTRDPKYNGVYTILDTGPAVQGRILDIYMWSCHKALEFGRKDVDVTVLRLGWNPRDSQPSLISTLFGRRERNKAARTEAAGAHGSTGSTGSGSAAPAVSGSAASPGSSDSPTPAPVEPGPRVEPQPVAPPDTAAPVAPAPSQ
jgi:3D (Asp-Asp-Asp) domain-containing protein